ncbi:MAG: hypothetical protein NTZ46_06525 [Verrucomicrobia bacterium]|nr:hypothetical protein [Verrucomicrobiota bacterium]
MFQKTFIAALALASAALVSTASANLIVAIDNTGANDPVNINNPRAWNFGVTQAGADYLVANGITFDSALFDAKLHKDTTAPLVFSIYSGLGGNVNGNQLLASVSAPASEFNQQYLGGQGKLFLFDPQTFTEGYYSVTLTSTAPDKATQDYFLKQGKMVLENADGTAWGSSYWLQDSGTGNAGATFNGTPISGGGDGTGIIHHAGDGSGGGGAFGGGGGIALAPEPSSMLGMAAFAGISLGGALVRRIRKQWAA